MFKPKCGIAKDLIPFEESASDFDDRSNEEACGSETEKLNVTPGFPDKIKAGDVLLVRFLRKRYNITILDRLFALPKNMKWTPSSCDTVI